MKKHASLAFLTASIVLGQDAWSERMSRANQLQQQGRYAEARELYQTAVADTEKSGKTDLRHAQALNNLAAHYYESGKYVEAEPMYRRAIAQWQELGETGRLGVTLSNLATLYRKTGRYKLAIDTFAEANVHIRAAYGEQSPELVSSLVNLSDAYRATGRLDDAESSAATALAMSDKLFSSTDARVSHSLHAYAIVLQSRGRAAEATPLLNGRFASGRRPMGRIIRMSPRH